MAVTTFSNPTSITLADDETTASTISVSGVVGRIVTVKVTLNNISHTWPDDLDFLLVGPGTQEFAFWTDAGGGTDIVGATIALTDSADTALPFAEDMTAGTYLPASHVDVDEDTPETSANWAGTPAGTVQHASPTGTTTFSSVFGDTFANGNWTLYVRDDFAGDVGNIANGWSLEIVSSGVIAVPQFVGSVDLGSFNSAYRVAGTGDFNADGTSDILWRNPVTGHTDEWILQNGLWSRSVSFGAYNPAWETAGVGDFNHDGVSDVIWRNPSTGQMDIWLLNNTGQWSASIPLGSFSPAYRVAGIGDFNGDGTSDILWRNPTTGQTDEWILQNGNWSRSVSFGSYNAAWNVAGVADFTGDGMSDVLWRNPTTGQMDIWKLIDGQWAGSFDLGSFNAAWQVAAVNDFNGDGTADIMFRNPATGQTEGWVIQNGQWAASFSLGAFDPAYRLAGSGDFNHSPGADLLWHNESNGRAIEWLLAPV